MGLGSFAFALLIGGELPYFVFYIMLLAVAVSFFWTILNIKMIHLSQETAKKTAYVGESVEIETLVDNKGLLPAPFVELKNEMIRPVTGKSPLSNIVSIMPLNSMSIVETLKCRYRGFYPMGPVEMTITDVLGIFSWTKRISCPGLLTVYPRIWKLQSFRINPGQTLGTMNSNKKTCEDYSSISDIRKYYPGDSFKRIHWKVSARKGMLHVKNFDMSGSAQAFLFLDMFQGGYNNIYRDDMEEKAVESAVSIIYYTLSKNINTGLFANCEKMMYIWGRDLKEFKKFIEGLVRLKSDGLTPVEELLESRRRLIPPGSSVIIITPVMCQDLIDRIVPLKEMGFDVSLVHIIMRGPEEENIKDILSKLDVRVYSIGINDDVKASLEGRL